MLYWIIELFLIFFVGAVLGYIIEVFYRRFVSRHKWMNPGFLNGPYLPLYGFGLVFLYLICEYVNFNYIPSEIEIILKILIITFSLTLVEFIAGLIFIKGLHIKLWDYSHQWGNIMGIICPLYSFFWGITGLGYYVGLHNITKMIVEAWSINPLSSFFVGIILGIFLIDMAISFNLATKISQFAKEKNIVVRFEEMKVSALAISEKFKDKISNGFDEYQRKLEEIKEDLVNPNDRDDRLAIIGFITSFIGFLIFPIPLCIKGYKSKKHQKLALAGVIISFIEILALVILIIIFY